VKDLLNNAFLIEISETGNIQKSFTTELFSTIFLMNENIFSFIADDFHETFSNHLKHVKNGFSSTIDSITYKILNKSYSFKTTLFYTNNIFYVLGLNPNNEHYDLIHEFLSINTDLANKINALSSNTSLQPYLEELSALNSELINTQRHLAQKNSELERVNSTLKNLSYKDYLTKIPNRRSFFTDVYAYVKTEPYWLIMIDFNNFKTVNDVLGHDYGDQVLIAFAKNIHDLALQFNGNAYRLGGDEFAMLIPQSVNFNFNDHIEFLNKSLKKFHPDTSIAYGIEAIDHTTVNESKKAEETMSKADHQMYEYKYTMKNKNKN
jgi:diguanylate cyclase (GGDEF)-like protein